jgi:hypothetical protein
MNGERIDKPQLHLKPNWIFELNKFDTLLILKALGSRLAGDEFLRAKELGDRLTELRAIEGRSYLGSLEHAEAAAASGLAERQK